MSSCSHQCGFRVLSWISIFTLIIVLTACGGGGSTDDPVTESTSLIISDLTTTVSTTSATLLFTSKKTGTVYYILQLGGSAPSVEQIQSGSGNGGSVADFGDMAIVTGSNGGNLTNLTEGTTYTLYIMGEDSDGNQSSIASLEITTSSSDTTAPVISNISTIPAATTASMQFDSSESGTAYYLVQLGGSVPSVAQIQSGSGNGGSVADFGDMPIVTGSNGGNLTNLTEGTTYTLYIMGEDSDGNQSSIASLEITTSSSDTTAPVISNISTILAATTASMQFDSSEAGTAYYAVQLVIDGQGTLSPTFEEVKTGEIKLSDGVNVATLADTAAMVLNVGTNTVGALFNLVASNDYIVYVVAEDATGNQSVVKSHQFTTNSEGAENVSPVVEANKVLTSGEGSGAISLRILMPTDSNDGDVLTATLISLPSNGKLSLEDGTNFSSTGDIPLDALLALRFTPDSGSAGTTSNFTYEISDGNGGNAQSTISTEVALPNPGSSGFIIAGYTPQDGFGIYAVDQGILTLVLAHPTGQVPRSGSEYVGPVEMVSTGSKIFFVMSTPETGTELWVYDGVTISLTADINPGYSNYSRSQASSDPKKLTVIGNRVYFIAQTIDNNYDGNGDEVWWTDGVTTQRVTSPEDGRSSWEPDSFFQMNGSLYVYGEDLAGFWKLENDEIVLAGGGSLYDGLDGVVLNGIFYYEYYTSNYRYELYSFDGTNVTRLTNIDFLGYSDIEEMIAYNNGILFFESEESVMYNLDVSGVSPVLTKIGSQSYLGFSGLHFVEYDGLIYYPNDSESYEFYYFDGTGSLPVLNSPFTGGAGKIAGLGVVDTKLFIAWKTTAGPVEFYTFDGTDYTLLTSDSELDAYSYFDNFLVSEDQLLFEVHDAYGWGHKSYQVTFYGGHVSLISAPGLATESSKLNIFAQLSNTIYFTADDGNGVVVMKHDSVINITSRVPELDHLLESSPGIDEIQTIGNKFYYYTYDNDNGNTNRGIWSYDGTTTVFEIPTTDWNNLRNLVDVEGTVYIAKTAFDYVNSIKGYYLEVYRNGFNFSYDFAPAIKNGTAGLSVLGSKNGLLYLSATDNSGSREVWAYDFVNDPYQFVDINQTGSSSPNLAGSDDSYIYINATNGSSLNLYRLDDTGVTFVSPYSGFGWGGFTSLNNNTYYALINGDGSFELFKYDYISSPVSMGVYNGSISTYFQRVVDSNGNPALAFGYITDLNVSDLILITDVDGIVKDTVLPGIGTKLLLIIGHANNEIILTGANRDVWSHDGSSATKIASFLNDNDPYTEDIGAVITGDTLYFTGAQVDENNVFVGNELWSWDTVNDLKLVKDINITPVTLDLGGAPAGIANINPAGGLSLHGDVGNDILVSSTSSDTMTGNDGADLFVFASNWGIDTIIDFEDGIDQIDLSTTSLIFSELTVSQVLFDTLVNDINGNSVTLIGIDPSTITAEDFKF